MILIKWELLFRLFVTDNYFTVTTIKLHIILLNQVSLFTRRIYLFPYVYHCQENIFKRKLLYESVGDIKILEERN